MHHVDLIMSKDGVEEIGEGRNQTRPQGVGEVMDLGDYPVSGEVIRMPGLVLPHSLKAVATAGLSLPRHSRLSMIERPTAGATGGGGRDGDAGFFPFSFFVGAMAVDERGEV